MSAKKRKYSEIESKDDSEELGEGRALSHAAQRRLRKRLKTVGADMENDGATAPQKATTDGPMARKSGTHAVWVGNLAFKTTPDGLRTFFENVGDITRVHMPTKALHGHHSNSKAARGDNRGFAYVDFATAEAMAAAIAKSEEHLDGRKLLIKDGADFAGRPDKDGGAKPSSNPLTGLTKTAKKILAQQKNPPCATLFVGNLGFETKEDEIAALFGRRHPKLKKQDSSTAEEDQDSPLLRVRMGTFEDSGKCKGFAFIDFKDSTAATDALTNPRNHSLNGRALVVEYGSADAVRRGTLYAKRDGPSTANKAHASRRPQKTERIAAKAAARQSLTDGGRQEPEGDYPGEDASSDKHLAEEPNGNASNPATTRKRPVAKDVGGQKRRQKSGAALAGAQREKIGIVPSLGKKIVFS